MIINPDVAAEVREAWIADQEHPHKGRDKQDYPDQQRLAELLDIAFRASLINEEGIPVRGSLVWLAPNDLSTGELPKRRESPLLLRLAIPRNLDADVLGKLAPATVGGGASLLVSWFDSHPKVWGIIYSATRQGLLAEVAAGIPEARHFSPDAPTIEITGTGSLTISRAGGVIGRIHKGEFAPALPTPFNSLAMGSVLYDLFGIHVVGNRFAADEDGNKASISFACLTYLLLEITKRGGGACIIFVPESLVASAKQVAQFPWDSEGGLEMEALVSARIRYGNCERINRSSGLFTQKANETLRQRLDCVASLASLDGATLLTPTFDVIGFGVRLQAANFAGNVEEGPDGIGGEGGKIVDFTRLGTRHNSALRFIGSVPGAIAFVVSMDGPIRGLTRYTETVVRCWPDCRVSMFK
jgi:hypothetical protein